MARVTVEDCILQVPNRFDLVLRAAQRARDISSGSPLTVDRDNDKNPVVALREIADLKVEPAVLEESLIQNLQRHVESDEPQEDGFDAMLGEGPGPGGDGFASEEIAEDLLTIHDDSEEDLLDAEEEGSLEGPEGDESDEEFRS